MDARSHLSSYTDYVARKYGSATIVFDDYSESSTKDMMHLRQTKGQVGVNVTFTEEMLLTMKKNNFSGKQYQQTTVHWHAQ